MRARRTTTLLAAAVLPMVMTGCGAGLDPQTYRPRTTQDAVNADIGDLHLRNVAIAPPGAGQSELAIGSDALLTMSIVSVSKDKDTLLAVSTPAASGVELVDGNGAPLPSLEVPPLGTAGPADFGLTLHGLTKALRPGTYIDVTFTFHDNGVATLHVPVKVFGQPVPRRSFSPKPLHE